MKHCSSPIEETYYPAPAILGAPMFDILREILGREPVVCNKGLQESRTSEETDDSQLNLELF